MNPVDEMKANLTDRLREYAKMTSPATPYRVTLDHAAAEIERLRAALTQISQAQGSADKIICLLTIDALAKIASDALADGASS